MKESYGLRILFLEDSEADKELAIIELKRNGLNFVDMCVETKEDFINALTEFNPDVVVSDYSLPKYDGMQALRECKAKYPHIPFLLLTGSMNEETAVECIKAGADDYVIKNRLSRLPFAILEAVKKSEIKKEKQLAKLALLESEERFRSYVSNSPNLIIILTEEGIIKYINKSEKGVPPEYFLNKNFRAFLKQDEITKFEEYIQKSITEGTSQIFEIEIELNNQRVWYDIKTAIIKTKEGSTELILNAVETTEKKKNEEIIKRYSRASTIISKINKAIVRIHSEEELLKEACSIIVNEGRYAMAWVGILNPMDSKIRISASSGLTGTYLEEINIDMADSILSSGLSERTIREGKKIIVNDIANNEMMIPWREDALKHGFNSTISIPLWKYNKAIGVLRIYSTERDVFNEEEIRLLKEVSSDISYAIEFIENEKERKRNEEALIKSEQGYRNLFEQANDAIIIFRYPSETIIEVNNKACEIYGFQKSELIGMSFKKITMDTIKGEKQLSELTLRKKMQNYESIHLKKDRTPINISVNASMIYYNNEEVVQCINRDITQNMKAIESLRISESKYRTIFETSNEGICIVDRNDKITSVNSKLADMLKYTVDELCLMNYEEIISSTDSVQQRTLCFDQKGSKINSYERRLMRSDGTSIWALITASPIYNKIGYYQGAFGMFADITDQKKAFEQLNKEKEKAEEMNKVKSFFFANMSHELRTPFVGIIGFAEIIRENSTDEEIKNLANGIIESSRRMTETLNNILDLSKLEIGNLEPFYEYLSAEEIVNEVYNSYHNDAQKKNIQLTKVVKNCNRKIKTDRSLVKSILNKIVSNAVKYTMNGEVTISIELLSRRGPEVFKMDVIDTGIGIALEKQNLIWQEFRQVSEGISRNFEGTGLGLTLVKKYVEALKGRIFVESKENEGSTFTVEIPVVSIPDEDKNKTMLENETKPKAISSEANTSRVKKILYIDDDSLALDVVTRYLYKEYSIECVSEVNKFMEKLNENEYDCILMNINLGNNINGIELIDLLKEKENYKNTPLVAVTAYALKSDDKLLLEKGFTHYISKPFVKKDFLLLIRSILNA